MTIETCNAIIATFEEIRTRLETEQKAKEPTVESIYQCSLKDLESELEGRFPLMENEKLVVRTVKPGEWYFDLCAWKPQLWACEPDSTNVGPRLILQPRRRLVFQVIGERPPISGESYYDPVGHLVMTATIYHTASRLILNEPVVEKY